MSEVHLSGADTAEQVAEEVRQEVENSPAPDRAAPGDTTTEPPAAAPEAGSEPPAAAPEAGSEPPAAGSESPTADPVAVVARERDEYLDALRRLQADFENYKKRMVRQQTEHLERAAEQLVGKLLPVLDTADLAVAHETSDALVQLRSSLSEALSREGLERIEPVGEPFDPAVADAVAHEPGDGGPMTVVEVMRAGYRWKGRVLRPAMVKVKG
jgi:molecular chaperone GrpE